MTKYMGRECEVIVPSYSLPCYVANNVLTKIGEALDCKVTIGTDYYSPVEVLVKNFQEIDANTKDVEIHLMGIQIPTAASISHTKLGVYETFGDGTESYIIQLTDKPQNFVLTNTPDVIDYLGTQ